MLIIANLPKMIIYRREEAKAKEANNEGGGRRKDNSDSMSELRHEMEKPRNDKNMSNGSASGNKNGNVQNYI